MYVTYQGIRPNVPFLVDVHRKVCTITKQQKYAIIGNTVTALYTPGLLYVKVHYARSGFSFT